MLPSVRAGCSANCKPSGNRCFGNCTGGCLTWGCRIVLGLGYHDTQCGFKAFNRQAIEMIFTAPADRAVGLRSGAAVPGQEIQAEARPRCRWSGRMIIARKSIRCATGCEWAAKCSRFAGTTGWGVTKAVLPLASGTREFAHSPARSRNRNNLRRTDSIEPSGAIKPALPARAVIDYKFT